MSENLNFGNGRSVNFGNFNGADSASIRPNDEKQKKIANSLFAKYDVNKDAILDLTEMNSMYQDLWKYAKDGELGGREAKKFLKALGIEGCNREDLLAFVNTLVSDKDKIADASTSNGITTVTYKQDAQGVTTTRTYGKSQNGKIINLTQKDLKDGVETLSEFSDDGAFIEKSTVKSGNKTVVSEYVLNGNQSETAQTRLTKETITEGNVVTRKEFSEDNKLSSQVIDEGAKTTTYDVSTYPPRPAKTVFNKGGGVTETTTYAYSDNGVVETTVGADNKFIKEVTKDAQGKQVKLREAITVEGVKGEAVEENGVRMATFTNSDGSIEQYPVNSDNHPVDYQYDVQSGEVWYAIAQAKYGVTDHKTTMQIVRKLKEIAGVSRGSKSIPSTITLPASVELKDGTYAELKNVGALASMKHNISGGPRITPPARIPKADLPKRMTDLPEQKITIPKFEINTANAGKTVQEPNGERWFEYDNEGRVIVIYDNEAKKKAQKNSVWIKYSSSGAIEFYQLHERTENGNFLKGIRYNGSGKLSYMFIDSDFDQNGNCGRQIRYNPDGTVDTVFDNHVYDSQGRIIAYDNFLPDGTWSCSRRIKYDNASNSETLYYDNTDRGKLTKIEE